MIIRVNKDRLLRNIATTKHKAIYNDLTDFVNDVREVGAINDHIKNKYHTEKMVSTDEIFKFRLSNGYRCLFKYENEHQIFKREPSILLLEVTEHDNQGKVGRRYDNNPEDLESERLDEEGTEDIQSSRHAVADYQRHIYVGSPITTETFMRKMKEADGRFLYNLESNQAEALKEKGPLLLMGSAGSGKTLVEISKALMQAHAPCKQIYLTFTPMLKEVGEALYKRYSTIEGIVGETDFYSMKGFMLETLNLRDEQFMSFERFRQWYHDEQLEMKYDYLKKVGPVDLWTEIRGLIKGYSGEHMRFAELPQLDQYLNQGQINQFIKQGLVKTKPGSNSTYHILNKHAFLQKVRGHEPLMEAIKTLDTHEPLIDRHTYLEDISENYSLHTQPVKKKLYKFVKEIYQPYLEAHGLYDDNDLARKLREAIDKGEVNKYDHVYVDEVQDLSELHILSLIELCEHPEEVYMTGDVSQIINPTLFVKGRVGALYKKRFKDMDVNTSLQLNDNYRNGTRILDIVSRLLDIRQERLGTYKDDIREFSRVDENHAGLPFYITRDKEAFVPTIRNWIGVPEVAIIVSGEDAKSRLKQELSVMEAEETNIYTVQEVKGREFYKTIVYNIVSDHEEAWEAIMNGPKIREKNIVSKYRFYFNLLYVAITRAKNNIFLFEKSKSTLVAHIKNLFEHLDKDMNAVMNIADYDTIENRYAQAKKHFKEGDYERAKTYYWQLDETELANIAKAYSNLQRGKFERGIQTLYPYKDHWMTAFEYTNKLLVFKVLLGYKTENMNIEDLETTIGNKSLINLIEPYQETLIYPMMLKDALSLLSKIQAHRIRNDMKTLIKGDEKHA